MFDIGNVICQSNSLTQFRYFVFVGLIFYNLPFILHKKIAERIKMSIACCDIVFEVKPSLLGREHGINWHIGACEHCEPEIVVVDEPSSCRWIGP